MIFFFSKNSRNQSLISASSSESRFSFPLDLYIYMYIYIKEQEVMMFYGVSLFLAGGEEKQ